MSFLKNIFKSDASEEKKPSINWIPLINLEQLNKIMNASKVKPVLIFKHSTRCGISRMALKNFEKEYAIEQDKIDLYYLDLLQFREISNEIVLKSTIQHQSPQVIVFFNEKVIYHDSHYEISVEAIKNACFKS